ncbi:MAG: hypothetical protein ACHQQR_10715 [Gemmatimonadales bacterium]
MHAAKEITMAVNELIATHVADALDPRTRTILDFQRGAVSDEPLPAGVNVADVLRALLNAECGPCADARAVLGAQDGETLAEAAKRVMRELTAGYAHEARAGAARLDAITGQPGHVGPTPPTRDTHGPSYLAGFNEGARMAVSQIADRLNLRADIESMGQKAAPEARVNVGAVLRDEAERLRRHMKITSEPNARCDPFEIPPGQH